MAQCSDLRHAEVRQEAAAQTRPINEPIAARRAGVHKPQYFVARNRRADAAAVLTRGSASDQVEGHTVALAERQGGLTRGRLEQAMEKRAMSQLIKSPSVVRAAAGALHSCQHL